MQAFIVALSLFGMAYAGGYGLETLSSLGLGKGLELSSGDSYGSYGSDDSYSRGGDELKGYRVVLVKSEERPTYESYSSGSQLSLGGDVRHGQYSPMPQQQVQYVPVPVAVKKIIPVPVDQPYTVKIDKPYPVKVERIVKKPYVAKVVRPVIEKTIEVKSKQYSYSH